jgi:hypothetical protein
MRELLVFKEYFWEFYKAQSEDVQNKIDYVLHIVIHEQKTPKQFFKHERVRKGCMK